MYNVICKFIVFAVVAPLPENTEGIQDFLSNNGRPAVKTWQRSLERAVRSDLQSNCPTSVNQTRHYSSPTNFQTTISCPCGVSLNNVTWILTDGEYSCRILAYNDTEFPMSNGALIILPETIPLGYSALFYCQLPEISCVAQVNVTSTEPDPHMSIGVQGFIVFIVVSIIVITCLCIAKYYKTHIYLVCRDSCNPASAYEAEKEFDCYISIANGDTERKFVERSFVDFLQRKFNYRFFVDDENLLKQLEYSETVHNKMHRCNRLIIVLTPAYMTNDWCMYCFAEGLRKILELDIPMLFIVSDVTVLRELNAVSHLVGHIPKITLPFVQSEDEKAKNIRKIRLFLATAAASGRNNGSCGIREPILNNAEDIDNVSSKADRLEDGSYGLTTKYTFGAPPTTAADINMDNVKHDNFEYDDDPTTQRKPVKVGEYKANKQFYSLTTGADEVDD